MSKSRKNTLKNIERWRKISKTFQKREKGKQNNQKKSEKR